MQEQQVVEQIRDGVQRLVEGTMDKAEWATFLAKSTEELDELAAEKRSADFWSHYNSTCYY